MTGHSNMKLFTVEEVAQIMRVELQTVRTWLRTRRLHGSKTPAGWRMTQADIDEFLEAGRNAPDGEQDRTDA